MPGLSRTPLAALSRTPLARARWIAVSFFSISSTLNYLDRLLLASVAPVIIKEFHLSNQDYGWLLSALALAYALASPVMGGMLDRLGLNRGASLAVGAWSLCCAATSMVRGFAGLAAVRIGLGTLESAGIPAVGKMNAIYLPPHERAIGGAISQTGLSLGGVLAPLVVYWMLPKYSWRGPFVFAGILGLIWVPLWLLVAKLIPPTQAERLTAKPGFAAWRDRRMLILGCVNILNMSTYVLWSNFTTLLLTHTFHETAESAARYAWFPPLAASLGGFAGGWLAMRWIRAGMKPIDARIRAVLYGAIGCLVTLAIPFAPNSLIATVLIGASYFATLVGTVNVYTVPLDLFGGAEAATATSVLVTAYGLLQIVLSPLIGRIVDVWGFGPAVTMTAFPPFVAYWVLRKVVDPGARTGT